MHTTPKDINARAKSLRKRLETENKSRWRMIEYQSWLTGCYTLAAIGTAFSKHGKYPDNPLELEANKIENIAEKVGKTPEQMHGEMLMMTLRINEANSNIAKRQAELVAKASSGK